MTAYKIYLCPVELPHVDPNPDCPRRELHTPQPPGYVEWFEWAGQMAYKGNTQRRCPGCNLYTIWGGGRA
jgi:hypothetical protein